LSRKEFTASDLQVEIVIFFNCARLARILMLLKGKVGPLAQLVEQRTFNPCVDGQLPRYACFSFVDLLDLGPSQVSVLRHAIAI
jgi:hypothetical protein